MTIQTSGLSIIWRWPAGAMQRVPGEREFLRDVPTPGGIQGDVEKWLPKAKWTTNHDDALRLSTDIAEKTARTMREEGCRVIVEDTIAPMLLSKFRPNDELVAEWKRTQENHEEAEESLRDARTDMEEVQRDIIRAIVSRAEKLSGITSKAVYAIGNGERVVKYQLRSRSLSRHAPPPKAINKKVDVRISIDVKVTDAKYNDSNLFGQVTQAEVDVKFTAPGSRTQLWAHSHFDEDAVLTKEEHALIDRFNQALLAAQDEHNLSLVPA